MPNIVYRRFAKRILDFVLAALGLIMLYPVIAVIALLIKVIYGSPVFFRQRRPGLHGAPFVLLKFRSMADCRGEDGEFLPDEERLTPFGIFLRKSSLDELPQLINVLKGEMSFVGPRPLLMRYLPYYSETERHRMDVLPGITGWAQIHGRNNLPWNERLAYDVWYVKHLSLFLDIRIIAATFLKVFQREGVNLAPSTAMQDLDVERREEVL